MAIRIEPIKKDTEVIATFGGIDKNIQIGENFFSHMKNMSSDCYPLLSSRKPRGTTALEGGISAMQICNTYGAREDISEGRIQEDVFALVVDGEDGAEISFNDREGNWSFGTTKIGGAADGTSLIARAGYVYAFPQGYRRACYSGGESGFIYNETKTFKTATQDKSGLRPVAFFKMQPSDSEGRVGDSVASSRTIDNTYSTDNRCGRGANELIYVTASGMTVNEHGSVIYIGADGIVKKRVAWVGTTIDLESEGAQYALTAIGTPREWLDKHCGVGAKVAISGDRVDAYDSNAYIVVYEKPDNPVNGTVWWDKGKTGEKYVWSSAYSEWQPYVSNYILLSYEEAGMGDHGQLFEVRINGEISNDNDGDPERLPFKGFKEDDAIKISGIGEEADGSYIIEKVTPRGLILNGVVKDIYEKDLTTITNEDNQGDSVTIERPLPKMDFVIESGNRLWGCYYGLNDEGKVINEIYASAQGDPTNWYRYKGISTDSWTATVGADGPFTGAIQYDGYPLFFKENKIIRVFGTAPSSFEIAEYNYRGVQSGSHKSLAICDEVLYYLSNDGVMAYNGSIPQRVSDSLGSEHYSRGVGGSIGSKYYLSCRDSSDNAHLFVFDARYGIWHREDDLSVDQFLRHKTELYMLTDGKIITASGEGETVEFEAVTGEWGLTNPFKKYFMRLIIRAIVPRWESKLCVETSVDGNSWTNHVEIRSSGTHAVKINNVHQRGDNIRVRFRGKGDVKIVSIWREIGEGGKDVC